MPVRSRAAAVAWGASVEVLLQIGKEQRLHVRIVRMRLEGIPEENQDINLALADLCPDLLVTAQRAAENTGDGNGKLGLDLSASCSCRDNPVTVQCFSVVLCPSQQVLLLIVVSHDRDGLLSRHSDNSIFHERLPWSSQFVNGNRMQ